MDLNLQFIITLLTHYPFTRYIFKDKVSLSKDVVVTEIILPYAPLVKESEEDSLNDVTIMLEWNGKEIEFYYNLLVDEVQEEIQLRVEQEFGIQAWQSLYMIPEDDEDDDSLQEVLANQYRMSKKKHRECVIRYGFLPSWADCVKIAAKKTLPRTHITPGMGPDMDSCGDGSPCATTHDL